MRIQKISVIQQRCNFCLDWFISKNSFQPPNSINACQKCFERARSNNLYRVVDPIRGEQYELWLKKTGLNSDEARSTNGKQLRELVQFYKKQSQSDKIVALQQSLDEWDKVESDLLKHSQPIRQLINTIFRKQMDRIEALWTSSLKDLEGAAELLQEERAKIRKLLSSYVYDTTEDSNKIFERPILMKVETEAQVMVQAVQSLDSAYLKNMFQTQPEFFFDSGFKLLEAVKAQQFSELQMPTETVEDNENLPDFKAIDQSIELHLLQQSLEQRPSKVQSKFEEEMLLDVDSNIESCSKRLFTISALPFSKRKSKADKENAFELAPRAPSMLKLNRTASKPVTTVAAKDSSARKADTSRNHANTSAKKKKNSSNPSSGNLSQYDQFDFKSFKQWPRQQVLQLLRGRGHLPKGFKSKDEKPHIKRIYPERVMTSSICQALDRTLTNGTVLELIGYETKDIEFLSYLGMVAWSPKLQTVKYVNVGLTNENLNLLLCFVVRCPNINCLVVSTNLLTQASLQILINFHQQSPQLKNVYMGRNYITHMRGKSYLQQLRQMGLNVFI